MCAGKHLLCFLILSIITFSVAAQKSKSQLQKEKQQNLAKIKEVEKVQGEGSERKQAREPGIAQT